MDSVARSSILIVEDELLIAMDLEQMLADMGFIGIVSKPTCAEVETWLATNTPTFAILDIHLQEGSCEAVAEDLAKRGVPFIVSTGLEVGAENGIFAQGKRVPKPCTPVHLADALKDMGISAVKSS